MGEKQCWYQTAKRWGQTNLTEDDPALCDLSFWKNQWARTGVQGLIINAGGIVAYYPSSFPLQYRACTLKGMDYFGMWNDAAREAGLAVIARMDINRATGDFYEAHPDWFCLDIDGNPIISQGRYFSCVNSGYYKEYIPAVLRELIDRYHPDGFSDNSWKGMDRKTICYCGNCKSKFKNDTGLELPGAVDWEDPAYRTWVRWSYRNRTDNWDLFNNVTKEYGGESCLWLGMLHADPVNLGGGFGDLKALCERSRVIFSDHQSREVMTGFEQNSINGNLLRLASDEGVLVPESMANYVRGPKSFRLAANPPEETQLWCAEGIAGGISPWYHHVGGGQNDRRQFETPVELFQWHRENEEFLYDRISMANVGVVWNQENADFYGRDDAEEKAAHPWNGICRALSKARIPFMPVNAGDISAYASRLDMLILPDVAILTASQEQAVMDFINNGGSIVLSGISSTLNSDGEKRESPLWELLGLRDSGERMGIFGRTDKSWENSAGHSYLLLPENRHEILSRFENTDILAFGGGLVGAESTGELQSICGYIPSFPIYPPEFSWIRERQPQRGSIFAGELKSGGKAVYFAADIDRCYGRSLLPDHGNLLADAVRWAAPVLPLSVEGPGSLDCCLYSQPGRCILHMVNISGADINPGYCNEFLPVGPFKISVRTELPIKSARAAVSGKSIPVKCEKGCVSLELDSITSHEMIVFE